jgi:hypothetical protein
VGAYTRLMPRHEPSRRTDAGEPPGAKVKMRLDEKGRWVPVVPERETTPTTSAAPRPESPDDQRPSAFRQIPPFGGAL